MTRRPAEELLSEDLRIVRAIHRENTGTMEERLQVIQGRFDDAEKERHLHPKGRWIAAASGPDYWVNLEG
jgi:hypothetical protein